MTYQRTTHNLISTYATNVTRPSIHVGDLRHILRRLRRRFKLKIYLSTASLVEICINLQITLQATAKKNTQAHIYLCNQCCKTFCKYWCFETHTTNIHTGEKPCDFFMCAYYFLSLVSWIVTLEQKTLSVFFVEIYLLSE